MEKRKIALKWLCFFLAAVSLAAMINGNAVAMRFAPGPGVYKMEYRSFFSMLPFGYGEMLPLVCGVLTLAELLFVLLAAAFHRSEALRKIAFFVVFLDAAVLVVHFVFVVLFSEVTVPLVVALITQLGCLTALFPVKVKT